MGEVGKFQGGCLEYEVSIGIVGVDRFRTERATCNRSRGLVGAKLTSAESSQGHLARCGRGSRELVEGLDWKKVYPVTKEKEVAKVDQPEDWTGSDALRCSPVDLSENCT